MTKDSAPKTKTRRRKEHNSRSSMPQQSPATVKDGQTGRNKRKASPEQRTPKTMKKRRLNLNRNNEAASSSVDTNRVESSSNRSRKRKAADDGEGPSRKKLRSPVLKDTQQTAKQTTQQTSQQRTHRMTKQISQQSTKQTTRHTTKETVQQKILHVLQQRTQHMTKQTVQQTTQQTTQHTTKQTVQHTTQQTTQHTTKQTVQKTTQQTTQHTTKQTVQQTTQHTTKQTVQQTTQQTTQHTTKQTVQQTTQHTTKQTVQQTTQQTTCQRTLHKIQQMTKDMPKLTPNWSSKWMPTWMTEKMAKQNVTVLSPRAKFETKYTEQNELGTGGCGSVFAGYRKTDNLPVAIKHVPKDSVLCKHEDNNGNQISVEVAIMEKLSAGTSGSAGTSAPVSLLDWYDLEQELILVMERPVPCVDLYDYAVTNRGCLQEEEAKTIMKQLIKAAIELEDEQIFHRDIKLENILIETGSDLPRVRLIDFGLSCFAERTSSFSRFYGTPAHIPPEWYNNCNYTAGPTTVWQMGVVLFDSLHRKSKFDTVRFIKNELKIKKRLSANCQDFLETCLARTPEQRPTLEQLQHHPWLR